MNDILVPADPADLIDRIIDIELRLGLTEDVTRDATLAHKHDMLVRLAARVLPQDAKMAELHQALHAARADIASLMRDLRVHEARKDYGTAFVALTQALLAATTVAENMRSAINTHATLATARPNRRFDA